MAEVLVQFSTPVVSHEGVQYIARACGSERSGGLWQGWIEFLPVAGGEPLRSGRETTQPKREDAVYWATGLTPVYLEGALQRALKPAPEHAPSVIPPPVFDAPAGQDFPPPRPAESILDPFSVYRKGETVLRRQLAALSAWHLVNIIRAHALSSLDPGVMYRMEASALIELIVSEVERQLESTAR